MHLHAAQHMMDNLDRPCPSTSNGASTSDSSSLLATSPHLRPASPSPSVSPSLALGACPSLDGSASDPSISSTLSSRSVSDSSQPSDAGSSIRRRNGFMRPQGTAFADSARQRDSVMCLGSIAALQYYFARTGLLDGKGAQMAKERKDVTDKDSGAHQEQGATDQETEAIWETMPAPAVSTYRHRSLSIEPLPDMPLLRRQLRKALDEAQKALETQEHVYKSIESDVPEAVEQERGDEAALHDEMLNKYTVKTETGDEEASNDQRTRRGHVRSDTQGWHEVQGLHILDTVTLAIRQARTYYVTHTQPQNLYALRSERDIRSDLYQVLDILKRMASRDFRGGMRPDERSGIASWIQGIHELLSKEEKQEADEFQRIHRSPWRHGDWTGREGEREWLFLNSFDNNPEPLPPWPSDPTQPSDFLLSLSKGLRLISLHNEMVRRSRRPFGEITTFYTDLSKPYRCAENLRYWAKAAELRWEIKLSFNALDVVHGDTEQAWSDFYKALQAWCRGVREELTKDWATIDSQSRPGTAAGPQPLDRAPDNKAAAVF